MGCTQQKLNQRQDVQSAESSDKDKKSNGINSQQQTDLNQKTTHQENRKDPYQIKLNPIIQRRHSPNHRKLSEG